MQLMKQFCGKLVPTIFLFEGINLEILVKMYLNFSQKIICTSWSVSLFFFNPFLMNRMKKVTTKKTKQKTKR